MRVHVLYFAVAREKSGVRRETLEVPEGTQVAELARRIAAAHPALAPLLPRMRIAVNEAFASPDARLPADAEVAVIPPVSGG